MKTNLTSKFRLIAWGFTIQLILMVFMIIISVTMGNSWSNYSTIKTCSTITMIGSLIGTLLCIGGSFGMIEDLRKRSIPTSGAVMCGISFSINLLVSIVSKGSSLISTTEMAAGAGVLFLVLVLAAISLVIVGVTQLSNYVRGLSIARNGYYTVIGAALLLVIVALAAAGSRSGAQTIGVFGIICALAIIVGYIMVITGWWSAVGGAAEIDVYDGEAAEGTATSGVSASGAEVAAYRESLRKLDDQQLKYIVDNPMAYKPSFVAEATSMLAKRQAWERLQGLTDQQLLDMVNAGTSVHSAEDCDVASMLLYSRKSPLFVSQFAGLSPDELRAIAGNPANYYEGYVEQAKELLNK